MAIPKPWEVETGLENVSSTSLFSSSSLIEVQKEAGEEEEELEFMEEESVIQVEKQVVTTVGGSRSLTEGKREATSMAGKSSGSEGKRSEAESPASLKGKH